MGSSTAKPRIADKHFRLDTGKLKRVQKVLSAKTETEAIERALDKVLSDFERERLVDEAHWALQKSGVAIRDVFGALDK